MTDAEPNVCGYCGHRYAVDSLARDCERKHESET
jgi:hypothetical protein